MYCVCDFPAPDASWGRDVALSWREVCDTIITILHYTIIYVIL